MEYELAEELRNAGFPQDAKEIVAGWGGSGNDTHNPTLEELIDQCGEHIWGLSRLNGGWLAQGDLSLPGLGALDVQPTPQEAVARLCLALHKVNVTPRGD